jgi:sterol desaturase/sphingolipid hydroxylase (fatty acid hydroxylase superfamily)
MSTTDRNRVQGSDGVRLFQNRLLESLTHVHSIVPLVFWTPVVCYFLWQAAGEERLGIGALLLIALVAFATWSLVEYLAHRFLFHFNARNRVSRYLVFLFHGVHHVSPQDKTRLVMPPAGGLLLMSLLWWVFSMIVPGDWLEGFMAFFIVGYLCYDYTHYAVHHFNPQSEVGRYLKRHHMQHHFRDSTRNFGVSSPVWDWFFRTDISNRRTAPVRQRPAR